MRKAGGKATLGELMGGASGISLDNLGELLGERKPELPGNAVGKYRLRNALRNRFGAEYLNIPGVKKLMADFDDQIRFNRVLYDLKQIKGKNGKSK